MPRRRTRTRPLKEYRRSVNDDFRQSARESIKNQILDTFYGTPLKYWQEKLHQLCSKNAAAHDSSPCGIYYQNFYLHPLSNIMNEPEEGFYYLPVHPDFRRKHEKELVTVTAMLGELLTEQQQTDRFLTCSLAFAVPATLIGEALNTHLLDEWLIPLTKTENQKAEFKHIDTNALASFYTFMEKHIFMTEVLAERKMENLIMQDVHSERYDEVF